MNNNICNCSFKKLPEDNFKMIIKKMEEIKHKLALTHSIALSLVKKTLLLFGLAALLIFNHKNPEINLIIFASITLIFNLAVFSTSPWFIDLSQQWFYQTRWISLSELTNLSPETAELIKQICLAKNIKKLRLGIINNSIPSALIYGSLPNSARLVVSKGLFTHLNEKEASNADVPKIGHIVH